ncbi:ATP synthase F1 subunit delta [Pasteuria penetrans]|uniref:ATP synthase F1 subunit delta n=1 Tax=Pasteuria penetrans TaxID=86005 RepID=UPI000FB8F630|nr:ATP synthase F1 subunit delta [Pasteuria penetrans]
MSLVAKRYALALFRVAEEQKVVDMVEQDMRKAARAFWGVPKLWFWLGSSAVPLAQKRGLFLTALRDVHPLVRNTFLLLLDRKRFQEILSVAEALHEYVLASRGEMEAVVMVAAALSAEDRSRVQGVFEKKLGLRLRVQWVVDDSLLGGTVVRVGDRVYDGSLSTQLARFAHLAARSEG